MQVNSAKIEVQDKIKIATPPLEARNDICFKELLDAVSSIIANEYIEIAKQNPDIFENNEGIK